MPCVTRCRNASYQVMQFFSSQFIADLLDSVKLKKLASSVGGDSSLVLDKSNLPDISSYILDPQVSVGRENGRKRRMYMCGMCSYQARIDRVKKHVWVRHFGIHHTLLWESDQKATHVYSHTHTHSHNWIELSQTEVGVAKAAVTHVHTIQPLEREHQVLKPGKPTVLLFHCYHYIRYFPTRRTEWTKQVELTLNFCHRT